MRVVDLLTVVALLFAWPAVPRAGEVAYEAAVEAGREPPVAITAAAVERASPRAEVTLRNTSRQRVTRIDLRWRALGEADRLLGEQVVGFRFPKPFKRGSHRKLLLLAPHPADLVRYAVEVEAIEFEDGTLWPPELWNRHVWASAERGEPWAWHLLGMQYLSGEGRPQDSVLAYAWLHLSAITGNEESMEARDALAAGMAPYEIEEAVKLSRTWAVDQLAPVDPP